MTHPTSSEADRKFRLAEIDLALFSVASDVHAIHMASYALEASLLKVNAGEFPPLLRSAEDLQSDGALYIGAFIGKTIVAAGSVEPSALDRPACIASLVVAPEFQRMGVGKALLAEIVRRYQLSDLTVSTAARNLPALGLYKQFGFVERARKFVGSANLELVQLFKVGAW